MTGWGELRGLDLTDLAPEIVERFWVKVDKDGPMWNGSPCWLFVGRPRTWYGRTIPLSSSYSMFSVPSRRVVLAHHVAYALTHGGILPPNLITMKECPTSHCIRHWTACSRAEAGNAITRAVTLMPVEEMRALRRQGLSCEEIAAAFPALSQKQVSNVIRNRTFVDPDYQAEADAQVAAHRVEYPSRRRITPEQVDEIKAEVSSGATLKSIAHRLGAPYSTVWEAIHGPSHKARRH